MNRFLNACLAAALGLAATACASLPSGPSLLDEGLSPRTTTVEAIRKIDPLLTELPALISAGVVSNNVTDDIVQYAPIVEKLAGAYFDATEACVVIDGALQSDPASGRTCKRSTLRAIYDELDQEIRNWALQTGLDTKAGQVIWAARLIVSMTTKPASGDIITGYRKEPDVPLEDFQAIRAGVKAKFETLVATAAARVDGPAK